MAFAPIFICSKHGEVDGFYYEEIDTENDEVYPMYLCTVEGCTRQVDPKLDDNGNQEVRALTDEEMFWDSYEEEF